MKRTASVIVGGDKDRLRSFCERVERLREEKAATASDEREVFAEAKAAGYDVKAMRACLKARAMEEADRLEQEAIEATYRRALGIPVQLDMLDGIDKPAQDASPIAVLGRNFEAMFGLAGKAGHPNAVDFNGKRFELERGADGELIVREVVKAKQKKAA
jgi:uncharacterized protein (UPF0335 family)